MTCLLGIAPGNYHYRYAKLGVDEYVRLHVRVMIPVSMDWYGYCHARDSKKVVPERLRTLDHGRPWSDDQFASTRLSSNRDMSR